MNAGLEVIQILKEGTFLEDKLKQEAASLQPPDGEEESMLSISVQR